jgi:predicted metalloprotease with PDZ domain
MLNLESKYGSTPEKGWWLSEPASNRSAFGIVLHQIDGNWVVARTLIGSPAEKAGLLKGQQLLAVDEYEVGLGKGDEYELQALMQLDASPSHRLSILTSSGETSREIRKRPLRELLEFDFTNGGATLGYCVGCRTCRTLIQGATDCSSGCPGNRCLLA